MKRSRIDEGQFTARVGPGGGAPGTSAPQSVNHGGGGLVHGGAGGGSTNNRILTTQHNSAPSIQYLNSGGTIKSNVHPDASSPSVTGSAPTVQYTTYYPYNSTITAKTVHSSSATGVSSSGSGGSGGGGAQMQILTTVGSGNNPVRGAGGISTKHIQSTNTNHLQQQQQQQQPTTINAGGIGGSTFAGQEKMQRLKVEDALSYLDQVKYKFGNQPQVYNDFLDIMKEFKSQSIDTPGVIQRVSNLFKGHPELIVGFNTFLPPGYKIEVQANDQGVAFQVSVSVPSPSGSNSIQITQQPTSPHKNTMPIVHTISQSSGNNPLVVTASSNSLQSSNIGNMSTTGSHSLNVPVQQQQQQQTLSLQTPHDGVVGSQNHPQQQQQPPIAISVRDRQVSGTAQLHTSNIVAAAGSGVGGISVNMVNTSSVPRPMDGTVMHLHGTTTNPAPTAVAAAAPVNNDIVNSQGHALHHISQAHQTILQAEQTGGTAGQPVEFNHAISYVNKIKNRFTTQPEKYKRFLEILHAYQKEQKNLREGIGPSTKTLSEAEVYSQVAKLFDQQDDLLREFGQFLPDASNHTTGYYYKVQCTANNAMIQEHGKKTVGGAAPSVTLHPHQLQQQQQPTAPAKSAYLTSLPMASGGSTGPSTVSIALDNDCGAVDAQQLLPDKAYGHPTSGGVIGVLGCGSLALRGLDNKDRSHSAGSGSSTATNHNVTGKYHPGHINTTIVQQHHAGDKRSSQSAYGNAGGNSLNTAGPSRGSGGDGHPPSKRQKPVCRDITLADASKYGSLSDYAFFDKVRKALRNPDVYENFLRCLTLFNQEIISKSELVGLISPFLSRFPELHRWFQDFLGSAASAGAGGAAGTGVESVPLPAAVQRNDHRQTGVGGAGGEHNNSQEIDLSTCKRLGASYCALPRNQESRKCTGRTALCREVLNDQWASFPTWAEDSTFVTSRKTHYEEIIYRCEDERFELDVVLETNSATIRVLEGVQKRMSRMPPDELSRFRLDDCLGGNSTTIHQRALRRIYGDKAADVIQGLKKNPMVAVPVALKRLKTKEEEWREAQKGFNKQWREQNEKYYLKSLDHQGINFKQNDIKALRSKSLFNEIEALYDERHEQNDDMTPSSGPHMVLSYKDKSILEDASNLLIHHVKRQTSIQKQEKTKIKYILRQFLPDMFFSPRQQLSDDERDDDADASTLEIGCRFRRDETKGQSSNAYASVESTSVLSDDHNGIGNNRSPSAAFEATGASSSTTGLITSGAHSRFNAHVKAEPSNSTAVDADSSFADTKMDFTVDGTANPQPNVDQSGAAVQPKEELLVDNHQSAGSKTEEAYTLFFGSSNWYLFLRLHWILCDRLYNVYEQAQILLGEELVHRNNRRESTATALRLKPKSDIKIEEYYPTFVDMLKNVLDGNMETNSYEDSLREMFGIHAYMAFTLDRVVTNAVRQLQHAVTERGAIECVELYQAQHKKNGAGGLCKTAPLRASTELTYQRRAEAILHDENCFKVYIFNNNCRVTLELLDTETDDTEKTVANTQKWNTYVDHLKCPISGEALPTSSSYTGENSSRGNRSANVEIKSEVSDADTNRFFLNRRPLFLNRNIRRFKVRHSRQTANSASPEIAIVGRPASVNSSRSQSCAAAGDSSRKLPSAANNLDTSDAEDDVHRVAKSASGGGAGGPSPPHSAVRIPERLGAVAGARENYTIDDCAEMRLNMTSYRMVFVMNKDVVFYKHNSIWKSRKAHPSVTRAMAAKFYKYVDNWCKDHVNEADFQRCYDWFMGRDKDAKVNTTTQIQHTDTNRTPYRAYNKYKCK